MCTCEHSYLDVIMLESFKTKKEGLLQSHKISQTKPTQSLLTYS